MHLGVPTLRKPAAVVDDRRRWRLEASCSTGGPVSAKPTRKPIAHGVDAMGWCAAVAVPLACRPQKVGFCCHDAALAGGAGQNYFSTNSYPVDRY